MSRHADVHAVAALTVLDASVTRRCGALSTMPVLKVLVKIGACPLSHGYTSDDGQWVGSGGESGLSNACTNAQSTFLLRGGGQCTTTCKGSGEGDTRHVELGYTTGAADGANNTYRTPDRLGHLSVSESSRSYTGGDWEFTVHREASGEGGEANARYATCVFRCQGSDLALRGVIRYLA